MTDGRNILFKLFYLCKVPLKPTKSKLPYLVYFYCGLALAASQISSVRHLILEVSWVFSV